MVNYTMCRLEVHLERNLIPSSAWRRSGWIYTLGLAALVAALSLISTPSPAEAASSDIWSATLTSGSSSATKERFGTDVTTYESLSDTSFSLGGTTHHINGFYINGLCRDDGNLHLSTDPLVGRTFKNRDIYLVVGPQGYSLAASVILSGSFHVWSLSDSELDRLFTDGEDTAVALVMVPAQPANLRAVRCVTQSTLHWDPSGDSSITKHQYQQKDGTGNFGARTDIPNSAAGEGNEFSYVVNSLDMDVAYAINIRPANRAGAGTGATATAFTVPGAPQNVAAVPYDGGEWLTWDAPASDGGALITSYEYQADDQGWRPVPGRDGSTRSYDLSGLTKGQSYTLKVRARSEVGPGAEAAVTSVELSRTQAVVPVRSGDAANVATPDGAVTVEMPANAPPERYRISVDSDSGKCMDFREGIASGCAVVTLYDLDGTPAPDTTLGPSPETRATIIMELNVPWRDRNRVWKRSDPRADWMEIFESPDIGTTGEYYNLPGDTTIAIEAISSFSEYLVTTHTTRRVISPVPETQSNLVPRAPCSFQATAEDRQVMLTWTRPDPRGTPITAYRYTGEGDDWVDMPGSVLSTFSCIVPGLTNGVIYRLAARSVSSAGAGPRSAFVEATPRAPQDQISASRPRRGGGTVPTAPTSAPPEVVPQVTATPEPAATLPPTPVAPTAVPATPVTPTSGTPTAIPLTAAPATATPTDTLEPAAEALPGTSEAGPMTAAAPPAVAEPADGFAALLITMILVAVLTVGFLVFVAWRMPMA